MWKIKKLLWLIIFTPIFYGCASGPSMTGNVEIQNLRTCWLYSAESDEERFFPETLEKAVKERQAAIKEINLKGKKLTVKEYINFTRLAPVLSFISDDHCDKFPELSDLNDEIFKLLYHYSGADSINLDKTFWWELESQKERVAYLFKESRYSQKLRNLLPDALIANEKDSEKLTDQYLLYREHVKTFSEIYRSQVASCQMKPGYRIDIPKNEFKAVFIRQQVLRDLRKDSRKNDFTGYPEYIRLSVPLGSSTNCSDSPPFERIDRLNEEIRQQILVNSGGMKDIDRPLKDMNTVADKIAYVLTEGLSDSELGKYTSEAVTAILTNDNAVLPPEYLDIRNQRLGFIQTQAKNLQACWKESGLSSQPLPLKDMLKQREKDIETAKKYNRLGVKFIRSRLDTLPYLYGESCKMFPALLVANQELFGLIKRKSGDRWDRKAIHNDWGNITRSQRRVHYVIANTDFDPINLRKLLPAALDDIIAGKKGLHPEYARHLNQSKSKASALAKIQAEDNAKYKAKRAAQRKKSAKSRALAESIERGRVLREKQEKERKIRAAENKKNAQKRQGQSGQSNSSLMDLYKMEDPTKGKFQPLPEYESRPITPSNNEKKGIDYKKVIESLGGGNYSDLSCPASYKFVCGSTCCNTSMCCGDSCMFAGGSCPWGYEKTKALLAR